MKVRSSVLTSLLLLGGLASLARAQDVELREPSWVLGAGAGVFLPQGSFADHSGTNAAYELFLSLRPPAWGAWGVRFTSQFVEHARSDTSYALPGIDVDTRTGSSLVLFTLGPEFELGRGQVRGLGHAGLGVAWASTETSIRAATNDVGNENFDATAVAFEAGAGLTWQFIRSKPVYLEMGGRWNAAGPLDYVPESGIRRAAGTLVLATRNGRMDGVALRAAVAVGLDNWMRR